MPRRPSVRYFPSRGAYYCQHKGKQHLLARGQDDWPDGPAYSEALKAFNVLMSGSEVPGQPGSLAVAAAVTRYYYHLEEAGSKSTLGLFRRLLDPAVIRLGQMDVDSLRPHHVNDWLAGQAAWADSTKRTAIEALVRVLNWSVRQGLIQKNPLVRMEKPEKLPRGSGHVLPVELMDLVEEVANTALARFLGFLRGTGCRPGEAMHATCDRYRRSISAVVHPWNPPAGEWRWKNAKKAKRDRVLYLTPALVELVEGEIASRKARKGLIFLSHRGRAWTNNNLGCAMGRLIRKPAIVKWCKAHDFDPAKILPYSYRHTFATDMLGRGCPAKLLADLMGTSVAMIERVYGHTHDDHQAMLRLFREFSGDAGGASGRSRS